MPFVLISIGSIIAYLDYMGTGNLKAAGNLLKAELFTNNPPYYKWLGALVIVGLIGYIPELQPVSMAFLVLILLAIILSKSHYQAVINLEKAL